MLIKYEEEVNDIKENKYKYEFVIILSPLANENNLNGILDYIALKGVVIYRKETLGLKSLAYAINGYTAGFYVILDIYTVENTIKELEKYMKQNEHILKYIFMRKDD